MSKIIILITGISGSGGSYLADYLVKEVPNAEIHGTTRWHSTSTVKNLDNCKDAINLHFCDLTDFSSILRLLEIVKPTHIFHLASLTNIKDAFINPLSTIQNNIMVTANLLEAINFSKQKPLIQICSTSEVYGQPDPKHIPITEDCPLRPINPYAVSKLTQDSLGHAYHRCYGMKIIITRAFGYINPRRDDLFATSFAKQIVQIEHGLKNVLCHGDLSPTRTLIDVRDIAKAYWALMKKGVIGETYNIGSEHPIKISECLKMLISMANCEIKTKVLDTLLRPSDIFMQVPCIDKFKKTVGWVPTYSFEESLQFLLNYQRRRLLND